jgi:hypothetical protein
MPDKSLVKQLESRLSDKFSQDLLQGALDALTQKNVTRKRSAVKGSALRRSDLRFH